MLDCGLVIEFGPKQHETVVKILGAFTRRQGRAAAQLMIDNASKCQANELDVEMFIKGIEQIIVEDAEQVCIRPLVRLRRNVLHDGATATY